MSEALVQALMRYTNAQAGENPFATTIDGLTILRSDHETRPVHRTRPGLEGGKEQDFVLLAVTDTGHGIPADIRDKIFDPFYTTKEGRGGTGLGLAVCSGIVKEHDGWIDVGDHAGGGAIFSIYLPT